MKFGTLIEWALLGISSKIGELLPKGSPWGAKIHKWVKNCNKFLAHRLAKHYESWHDDKHWSVAGLKRLW